MLWKNSSREWWRHTLTSRISTASLRWKPIREPYFLMVTLSPISTRWIASADLSSVDLAEFCEVIKRVRITGSSHSSRLVVNQDLFFYLTTALQLRDRVINVMLLIHAYLMMFRWKWCCGQILNGAAITKLQLYQVQSLYNSLSLYCLLIVRGLHLQNEMSLDGFVY